MTTRAAKRNASRSGSRADPAVVRMLTAWSLEHPGDFRLYVPHKPRSEEERVAVYVVTPPEPPLARRPLVRVFSQTEAETLRFADDLGLRPPDQ